MDAVLSPRLASAGPFPWLFFGRLIGFGVVAILFMFYFNRALGYILTVVARKYLWHYYRSSVTIEAIQLAPLAGRVFLKNVKYHGKNETISISACYVTWKYWSRRVLRSDLSNPHMLRESVNEKGGNNAFAGAYTHRQIVDRLSGDTLPRIVFDVRGLEWFVYNRSQAYGAVLTAISKQDDRPGTTQSGIQDQAAKINPATAHPANIQPFKTQDHGSSTESLAAPSSVRQQDFAHDEPARQELPGFLTLFPIGIVCKKTAMIMGNDFTESILVATATAAEGLIDARNSRLEDLYKQCFDFVLENFDIKFRKNESYVGNIFEAGAMHEGVSRKKENISKRTSGVDSRPSTRHKLHGLLFRSYHLRGSATPSPTKKGFTRAQHVSETESKWRGLSRYLDPTYEESPEHVQWKSIEYAKVSEIADCPKVMISFFWDVPGRVTQSRSSGNSGRDDTALLHINNGPAPEWGFHINIAGGTVNYGPWADKQRANLQNVFFPSSYSSAIPAQALEPGQQRQSTQFKIVITLDDVLHLRLHTREESKDWRWKSSANKTSKPDQDGTAKTSHQKPIPDVSEANARQAGWLYLTVAADASFTYTMDMLASSTGFGNKLELDAASLQLTTSVNHGTFMSCKNIALNCDLSNPLEWNQLRTWLFTVDCNGMELFFLRDHAFLLTDLINDWTSGPPNDFMTFVPFLYKFDLDLSDITVHLNVNDANIIDVPASLVDNAYLRFGAQKLSTILDVPATRYRPQKNAVKFDAKADGFCLDLLPPTWNTLHSLLDQKRVGTVEQIVLKGCYEYCTSNSPAQTDILTLDVNGENLALHLYGFLIRHFMVFRENYFGDDMHFQTLEEYQHKLSIAGVDTGTRNQQASSKISNDLDVILTIYVKDSCLILPTGIYSAAEHIKADIPSLDLDLRFTNYYMDVDVSLGPISLRKGTTLSKRKPSEPDDSRAQLFLDGLWLTGHRLFGLPPAEPTYVCNWDFVLGRMIGECSLDFMAMLAAFARAFPFQFKDIENALPRNQQKTIHDVTFLRVKMAAINLWFYVQESIMQLQTGDISVKFDDLAGEMFSERLTVDLPNISFAILDLTSATRQQVSSKKEVITHGLIRTSVSIRTAEAASRFRLQRQLQQDHVRKHDSRTHRTPWLLLQDLVQTGHDSSVDSVPVTMPIPPMPEPIDTSLETLSISSSSIKVSSSSASHERRSSFLSGTSGKLNKFSMSTQSIHYPLSNKKQPGSQQNSRPSPLLRSSSVFAKSPSKLTVSSPYAPPHFLLQHVQPQTRDLPSLNYSRPKINAEDSFDNGTLEVPEDEIARSMIMISCQPGIAAFFTLEALKCVIYVMEALQPVSPSQILDDIQMTSLPQVRLGFNKPKAIMSRQIRFELPQLAMRFITQSTIPDAPFEWQTYEAGLSSLVLTLQSGLGGASSGFDPAGFAGHLSLDFLRMAVRGQQSESMDDEARVQVNLESTTAWLHSNGKLTGRIRPDSLEIISLNRKVEYLAAIVNNAFALSENIMPDLKDITDQPKARQQSVVHFLSCIDHDLADPIFLNSASYIARATTEHARNSDTWKMGSRLRHVLDHLSKERIQRLDELLQTPSLTPNVSRFDEVVDAFRHWRGWDLDHLVSSAFMRQVFGVTVPVNPSPSGGQQISVGLNLDSILAVIDPGPMQNQVELQHIAVSTESTIEPHSEHQSQILRTTAVSLSCNNTVIQLNWEILEFVEGVLRRLGNTGDDGIQSPPHEPVAVTAFPRERSHHKLHLVAGFETIDLGFKTINLEVVSLTRSLKTSAIAWQTAGSITGINAVINAEFNTTRVLSHSQLVLVVQLLAPFLHGALSVETVVEAVFNLWSGGGFCQKVELEVHQDLLGLLGIVDLLVRDELGYIQSLFAAVDKRTDKQADKPKKSPGLQIQHQFYVALLLDDYRVSLALLSTLHYILRGNIARSMLQSKEEFQKGFNVNFDIKQHVHALENHAEDTTDEIASLELPPISARIMLDMEETLNRAIVVLSLEKILLDASAIHALFSTFSRQEVSTFRKDVSRDIAILKSNLQGIMPKSRSLTSVKPAKASPIFFYTVEVVADGLEVAAVTGKNSKQPARLVLDIGPTMLNARNEDRLGAKPLAFMKANSKIQDIRILLERSGSHGFHSCGDVSLSVAFEAGSAVNEDGKLVRSISVLVTGPEINIFAETAPTIVDILGYMQQKFKNFSLSEELHGLRARRNRTKSVSQPLYVDATDIDDQALDSAAVLFNTMFSIELSDLQIAWRVGDIRPISPGHSVEDLVFSIERLNLASRHANSAQLVMLNLQLQMVPKSQPIKVRSRNSALMPEVLFNVAYVSTSKDRRFAFQAVGKSVDLRFTPRFILPATDLQRSMALATQDLRKVIADWNASFIHDEQNKKVIAAKRISSILIDADFAGAVINLQATGDEKLPASPYSPANLDRGSGNGEQFHEPGNTSAVLRTPGIAFKVEYSDLRPVSHTLSAEIRVDASSNTLQPSIVPLILELTNSIREVVHEKDATPSKAVTKSTASLVDEEIMAKPVAILGDCKLNLGLRICRQKFGLSCQPIAKVEARAEFDDIYITINTVEAEGQERFFALSAKIQNLQASVQHTYSQEATGRFVADHISLSLMNSRHVSNLQGISAILNFGPMKLLLNVRKLHDFLLFHEIWLPEALQQPQSATPTTPPSDGAHGVLMHRYQQVASTNPFPWSATVVVEEVDVELDLGQSLGRSTFQIDRLWTVSRKISNWEQNLHVGFRKIKLDCAGRLDCYLGLENLALRSSIKWPEIGQTVHQIPLVQASLGFDDFKIKAAFEYQSFLVGNFSSLNFLMYNVREGERNRDRLVCMIEGDKIQAFCTTQSSASMLALYQAMQRLILEKRQSFENSLRDIQRYYRRTKLVTPDPEISRGVASAISASKDDIDRTPLQLQTNVVISLKQLNIGAYPRSFMDSTIFKLEALDASARFSVVLKSSALQSSLGMSLGQVRIALSNINRSSDSQTVEELSVEDVVRYSTASRGGTILKVPRVNAVMQTWQHFGSTMIEYIFRSSFEGKVEVGWNINRINVIRTMWNNHSKALASRLGKALPQQSAVHITGVPTENSEDKEKQDKITAVVNMPVSKYSYQAREPPVIETPQLRDMGEATPPLEWIGLHREKLPNLTHQIVIVPLLEVAKEVEDAYSKILGAS